MRAAALGLPPRALSAHADALFRARFATAPPPDLAAACDCDAAFNDGHGPLPRGQGEEHRGVCRVTSLAAASLPELRAAWPEYCPTWGAEDLLPPWEEQDLVALPAAAAAPPLPPAGSTISWK